MTEVRKPEAVGPNPAGGQIFQHTFRYSLTHSYCLIPKNKCFEKI